MNINFFAELLYMPGDINLYFKAVLLVIGLYQFFQFRGSFIYFLAPLAYICAIDLCSSHQHFLPTQLFALNHSHPVFVQAAIITTVPVIFMLLCAAEMRSLRKVGREANCRLYDSENYW